MLWYKLNVWALVGISGTPQLEILLEDKQDSFDENSGVIFRKYF